MFIGDLAGIGATDIVGRLEIAFGCVVGNHLSPRATAGTNGQDQGSEDQGPWVRHVFCSIPLEGWQRRCCAGVSARNQRSFRSDEAARNVSVTRAHAY